MKLNVYLYFYTKRTVLAYDLSCDKWVWLHYAPRKWNVKINMKSIKKTLLQGSTVLWEKRKYLNVEKLHTSAVKYAYNYQVHKKKTANLHF